MVRVFKKTLRVVWIFLVVFMVAADEDPEDCVLLNDQCVESDICCQNVTTNLKPEAFSHVECNFRAEYGESRCQEIIHYDQYVPEYH